MNRKETSGPRIGGENFKNSLTSVLAAFFCIIIGLVAGYVVLFIINSENAWENGLLRIMQGGFYDVPYGVGRTLSLGAPLIMTGLSVAFAFKTGLFNIGVAGQYTLGAFGALFCAIVLKLPWWLCLIGSALCGGLWGLIPGLFKAFLNINEVITAIMFNWIGLYLVNEIIYGGGYGAMYDAYNAKTYSINKVSPDSIIPDLGLAELFRQKSATVSIFLAIIVAVVIYIILQKTIFGYELKACGFNKDAARYAGINEKKNIVLSMTIAGMLGGFGAGLYYLSGGVEWSPLNSTALPVMGFNGISVALLASSNPIGTIFSGLFIAHISVGGAYLPSRYFPSEVANVITGIIIYLCAFSMLFKTHISALFKKLFGKGEVSNVNDEPDAEDEKPGKEAN